MTTRGPIATHPQNLNFVFSDEDSFRSQWQHLYKTLPVLLYYATEIVDLVIGKLKGTPQPEWITAIEFRKIVGLRLLAADDEELEFPVATSSETPKPSDKLELPCAHCDSWFPFSRQMWRPAYEIGHVECPVCQNTIALDDVFSTLDGGSAAGE